MSSASSSACIAQCWYLRQQSNSSQNTGKNNKEQGRHPSSGLKVAHWQGERESGRTQPAQAALSILHAVPLNQVLASLGLFLSPEPAKRPPAPGTYLSCKPQTHRRSRCATRVGPFQPICLKGPSLLFEIIHGPHWISSYKSEIG